MEQRKRSNYKHTSYNDIPILPITYINQRNQLLKCMFICSRLAVLYYKSSQYSQINVYNQNLIRQANVVGKNLKCNFHRQRFLGYKKAAGVLQSQLRLLIIIRRNQMKVDCLGKIKRFLFRNYNQNTFMGPVKLITDSSETVRQYIAAEQQLFRDRQLFVALKLREVDSGIAYELAQRALFENDVKMQKASRKQFVVKDPASFVPEPAEVDMYRLD